MARAHLVANYERLVVLLELVHQPLDPGTELQNAYQRSVCKGSRPLSVTYVYTFTAVAVLRGNAQFLWCHRAIQPV